VTHRQCHRGRRTNDLFSIRAGKAKYAGAFTLNPNCFHLDFGMPTLPINHENIRQPRKSGDEQVGSITC